MNFKPISFKILNAIAFGSIIFSFASHAKASPMLYASTTSEQYNSGVSWQDSNVDSVWKTSQGNFIAGAYQRNRAGSTLETGYKIGFEVDANAHRSYRVAYTTTPNSISLAHWGLSGGLVEKLSSSSRVEFDLGTRRWSGYDLYEGRAAYFQTFGKTELLAGVRLSAAQGASSSVPFLGMAHDIGRLTVGAQLFSGQAIADHTVSAVNDTYRTKGGQLSFGYQLSSSAWLRAIVARSYETLGWKSSNAIVLAYDFN